MDPLDALSLAWAFYRDVFLLGFLAHPLLPLLLLLLVLLLTGNVGATYGVHLLVRHENRIKQFFVGFVLGLLVPKVLVVGYLLQTREPGTAAYTVLFARLPDDWSPFWTYAAGTFASFVLTLLAARGLLAWTDRRSGARQAEQSPRGQARPSEGVRTAPEQSVAWWPLALGVVASLGLSYWLLVEVGRRNEEPLRAVGRAVIGASTLVLGHRVPDVSPEDLTLHGLEALVTAGALLFYALVVYRLPFLFSPVVALCFLLNVMIAVYGYLSFFLPGSTVLLLALLAFLAVWGGVPPWKLRFPALDYNEPRVLDGSSPVSQQTGHVPLTTDEVAWPVQGGRQPLVLVCASGGGIRSAVWTALMLKQLEARFAAEGIAFPYHVRLISGASGGMVGAAWYVANLGPPDPSRPAGVRHDGTLELSTDRRRVVWDWLTPVVYRMIYGDLLNVFLPRAFGADRGQALERAWRSNLKDALDRPFAALADGEREGWRPSLVLAPMLVEDGRRLLVSNLDLGELLENRAAVLGAGQQVLSREGVEFFRLFPDAVDFTLATAARMSASFPYFAPAVALPTQPRRRVVDAGYFDNYGVSLAAAWLFQNRSWVADHASGVVLVQLRDGLSERDRTLTGLGEPDPSTAAARGLEWLTSPPEGLFNGLVWTTSFRNDEQLELLANLFNGREGPLFFTTATFEFAGEVSLSWYLTGREQVVLQEEARRQGSSDAMSHLLSWWRERTAAAAAGTSQTEAMRGPAFLPRPEEGGRA